MTDTLHLHISNKAQLRGKQNSNSFLQERSSLTCDISSRTSFAIILGNLILIYFAHADSKSLFTQCCVRTACTSVATLELQSERALRVENQFVNKPQETSELSQVIPFIPTP